MKIISEWDPVLTPNMHVYALIRLAENMLQIKLHSGYVVNLDSKAIPQLIKILTRLEKQI